MRGQVRPAGREGEAGRSGRRASDMGSLSERGPSVTVATSRPAQTCGSRRSAGRLGPMAPSPDGAVPPGTDLSRYDDWLAWLRDHAATDDDVRVVWIGGSAATGGWDEWS